MRTDTLLQKTSLLCLLLAYVVASQPSGGPYGPLPKMYEIPKTKGQVYYVSPDGKSENSGRTLSHPTSIEAAISQVKTDDVIILRGGIYRTGNLILNQGVTIQPYKNEHPVFKGTLLATEWQNLQNGLWRTRWNHLFPSKPADWWRRYREGKKTPLHRFNNDMVFVNGKFLQSVGWEGEVTEDTYYIDYDSAYVYIGVDPTDKVVEITAYDVAILRTIKECNGKQSDRRGYTLRGITFTQYAYRALEIEGMEPEGKASEFSFGKDVVGTTIEHCTISYCSRVAGYLRGDSMTIRHCEVNNTSTEGIYIISSNDVLLEKNAFSKNNIENITGYYPAAVKIFNQCHRVVCNDNYVYDLPNSNGIWYDVGNVDGVFVNNWVEGVGNKHRIIRTDQVWPSDNGFFFEISQRAICAGNLFVDCDHGMLILNSSGVQIYNNTFVNSMACIGRNARSAQGDHFGWHPSTGPDVDKREGHIFVNNLLVADETYHKPLLFVWQPSILCNRLEHPQLQQIKNNLFLKNYVDTVEGIILWSPYANEQCQKRYLSVSNFEEDVKVAENNLYKEAYRGVLFREPKLKRFEPVPLFHKNFSGTKIPDFIIKYSTNKAPLKYYIGAFPPIQ